MDVVFEAIKVIVCLALLATIVDYLLTEDLPPYGRGRWRNVLDGLDGKKRRRE
jgi:hypothetical protein